MNGWGMGFGKRKIEFNPLALGDVIILAGEWEKFPRVIDQCA